MNQVRKTPSEWPHLLIVYFVVWILYLITAPRTVVLEDDGLFILSSWFLGIEHPPGYPLYVLLGKLATLFPFGSPAWRVHALSGLFGALACIVMYLIARLLIPGRTPAYLAAVGLGVSATFWSQAIIADVYSLHALIFFSLLFVSLRVYRAARSDDDLGRLPEAAALLTGLGIANHWPLLFLSGPGLALLWWPALPRIWRRLPILALWLAVGLLPYAWMVWRSQMQPEISFAGPIDSWRDFADYFLRRYYSKVDNMAGAGWYDKLLFLSFLVREAGSQMLLPGAALALAGFFYHWQRWGKMTAWALTLAFAGPTLLLTTLLNFEYQPLQREMFRVYPTAAWGLFSLWAALGLRELIDRVPSAWRIRVGAGLAAAIVASTAAVHWGRNDRSSDWIARDHAAVILDILPPNATLMVQGDNHLPAIAYLHLIEGRRSDVSLISANNLVLEPKLFDNYTTPPDERKQIIERFISEFAGTLYRVVSVDSPTGYFGWLATRIDKGSVHAGPFRYTLRQKERELAAHMVDEGPLRDGWSEELRRFLLTRLAYFQAVAEQEGQWPDDDALAHTMAEVMKLPEAALARAAGLNNAGTLANTQETDELLQQFASQADSFWVSKGDLNLYYALQINVQRRSRHSPDDRPDMRNQTTSAETPRRNSERK